MTPTELLADSITRTMDMVKSTISDFSDAEKVALELAESVTRDPHEVDDEFWAQLRQHFDEGEIIELLAAIGLFNYFNRFNDALRMEPTR